MVRRAVEAKINAKGNGRPGRVLGTTIEADLRAISMNASNVLMRRVRYTLFAGLVFNFSNIFCD